MNKREASRLQELLAWASAERISTIKMPSEGALPEDTLEWLEEELRKWYRDNKLPVS